MEALTDALFEALIAGNRELSLRLVNESFEHGLDAEGLIVDLFWPVYTRLEHLHRADQLSKLAHHMATRLLRVLADRTASRLERREHSSRTVLCMCGPSESEELGAQMAVDLIESYGFDITFIGGGVAADEILARVNNTKPDVLLMFSSAAADLPELRRMIDSIREIGASGGVQIAVGGGVFGRAEGLAEEIGADIWAHDPIAMVELMVNEPERRAQPEQRTVGKSRRPTTTTTRAAA